MLENLALNVWGLVIQEEFTYRVPYKSTCSNKMWDLEVEASADEVIIETLDTVSIST